MREDFLWRPTEAPETVASAALKLCAEMGFAQAAEKLIEQHFEACLRPYQVTQGQREARLATLQVTAQLAQHHQDTSGRVSQSPVPAADNVVRDAADLSAWGPRFEAVVKTERLAEAAVQAGVHVTLGVDPSGRVNLKLRAREICNDK
ncbi:hypothetical protein WJX72_008750 [[Myrmecia] bisecta]|uniref:Uncharacterized protein n=1 Tax=[Myrmecia] bisecta TaxID=41462 RepID=A0AAW1R9B3_9CHLO